MSSRAVAKNWEESVQAMKMSRVISLIVRMTAYNPSTQLGLCFQVPDINLISKYSDCNTNLEMGLLRIELHPKLVLNYLAQKQ